MKKSVIGAVLLAAFVLSGCLSPEEEKILAASAATKADLIQVPGLVREPLPVNMTLPDGTPVVLEGMVTRPDRPGRFPLVLINHGTNADWDLRKDVSAGDFAAMAIDFAQRGWAAVSVVRPGFGRSGGPYLEDVGPCNGRHFLTTGRRMGDEILAILDSVRLQPWVDPSHVLLVGHSGGGFASLAAAATNPKAVIGVINFAGGHGAILNEKFCQPENLFNAMSEFGRMARIPSLWIYADNDHWITPDLARNMFRAYKAGGAPATFLAEPAYKDEGHFFIDAIDQWQPPVEAFMQSLHVPTAIEVRLPDSTSLQPPSDLDYNGRAFFTKYLALPNYEKAYAVGSGGGSGYGSGYRTIEAAKLMAMQECRFRSSGCRIYAVGNQLAPQ